MCPYLTGLCADIGHAASQNYYVSRSWHACLCKCLICLCIYMLCVQQQFCGLQLTSTILLARWQGVSTVFFLSWCHDTPQSSLVECECYVTILTAICRFFGRRGQGNRTSGFSCTLNLLMTHWTWHIIIMVSILKSSANWMKVHYYPVCWFPGITRSYTTSEGQATTTL